MFRIETVEPARWAAGRSVLAAAGSVVRGLPLFVAARPGTPLRVLCVMALGAVHVGRAGRPLPAGRVGLLAALLDLGAAANAALDGKRHRRGDRRETVRLLRAGGVGPAVAEYLRRLRALERGRPRPGGGAARFGEVRRYREGVVRLSLGALAAVAAEGGGGVEEGVHATHADAGMNLLFRIAMQCQIIDDVLDWRRDVAGGLPSFLTACASRAQAIERTRGAVREYAGAGRLARTGEGRALRLALSVVSACARLAMVLGRWRLGSGGACRMATAGECDRAVRTSEGGRSERRAGGTGPGGLTKRSAGVSLR